MSESIRLCRRALRYGPAPGRGCFGSHCAHSEPTPRGAPHAPSVQLKPRTARSEPRAAPGGANRARATIHFPLNWSRAKNRSVRCARGLQRVRTDGSLGRRRTVGPALAGGWMRPYRSQGAAINVRLMRLPRAPARIRGALSAYMRSFGRCEGRVGTRRPRPE